MVASERAYMGEYPGDHIILLKWHKKPFGNELTVNELNVFDER